jgi:hypothetical protein
MGAGWGLQQRQLLDGTIVAEQQSMLLARAHRFMQPEELGDMCLALPVTECI